MLQFIMWNGQKIWTKKIWIKKKFELKKIWKKKIFGPNICQAKSGVF